MGKSLVYCFFDSRCTCSDLCGTSELSFPPWKGHTHTHNCWRLMNLAVVDVHVAVVERDERPLVLNVVVAVGSQTRGSHHQSRT